MTEASEVEASDPDASEAEASGSDSYPAFPAEFEGENLVSAQELGPIIGLHERQVRKLAERGVLHRDGLGRYAMQRSILTYIVHLRELAAGRTAAADDDGAPDLARERALLARAQREGQAMKNGILRGTLLPVEDVEAVVGAVLDATRAKVLGIPTKAAPHLLGLKSLPDARDTLTSYVHDTLGDLAGTSVVVGSAVARARGRAGGAAAGGEAAEAHGAAAAADGQ